MHVQRVQPVYLRTDFGHVNEAGGTMIVKT
jgi:hypothetical protein